MTHRSRAEAEPRLARRRATYVPNHVLLVTVEGEPLTALSRLSPLVEGKAAGKGPAIAYVCRRGVCDLPTADPSIFEKQIRKIDPLRGGMEPDPDCRVR